MTRARGPEAAIPVSTRTREPEYDDVQVPWRKSSWSDDGAGCVTVAYLGTSCAVKDSRTAGPYFVVSIDSWRAFVAGVKRGEIVPEVVTGPDGAPSPRPIHSDRA
ncbi:DUF397 domain-containing protein [Nonomuraea sp. MCN248]|uniref:DUF397 domain-containing protein n=1 Tax=Nonomuraea corallina TaxID=2989783 RepID=A0ABT4SFX8_9ACTN|nr:DUF397 domain-containing protein [Nonomuraea corallina]MDA0636114.1 DUF397 domain-containing protein [Nonomuraea corallina]